MGRESMAEKEKRQMVQKSDNEFVKSRIELHCIVPFANTIIPDSRKRKQPLRTRTFPNLRTMNGLQFIDGIGTSGCLRAERFPLPVQPAFGRTRKIPPGHLLPPDRGNNGGGGIPGWCFRHQPGFLLAYGQWFRIPSGFLYVVPVLLFVCSPCSQCRRSEFPPSVVRVWTILLPFHAPRSSG